MSALSLAAFPAAHPGLITADFRSYLEHSENQPTALDLRNSSLLEVIDACAQVKTRFHPQFRHNVGCLRHNLIEIQREYGVILKPIQVTDIFYGYFLSFCEARSLRNSTIKTMCSQLRSILCWAAKYNAQVSATYTDFHIRRSESQEIALTADEVSRISYFDIDRFYAGRRSDLRDNLRRVRDHFVLSCNLFQRYGDMRRISPECFDRNIFSITQQKTGTVAVVDIDLYAIDAKTTYRILEHYGYRAPYQSNISNYNHYLHTLMRDIGFTEPVRKEEIIRGELVVSSVPKWKEITSHTARRTAISVGVLRGKNVHALRKCSGHTDLSKFSRYIKDE